MRGFAALFPGQGAQYPGMGKDLAATEPAAAEVFREADRALGFGLREICFAGTEADLARTEITQPAILTVAVAAFRAFVARGGARPVAAAGHSLGEYAAHVAAETIPFDAAVRAVRERGRFMQEAVPEGRGAMAAILGLPREELEAVCREAADGEVVSCANFNGPGQIVIAGHAGAVARACEGALRAGAKRAVPLSVSAPFHCALMKPAAERLAPVLEAIPFADPAIPVYTNADAERVQSAAAARSALARQVEAPVRWDEEVARMCDAGIDRFVEFGPGKVLAGLVRRIRKDAEVLSVPDGTDVAGAVQATGS
ncbi:MAG TPA: ACP S-malonyltransferase [Candidatus Polarisedimenticolaceae bacterium]|nr:ACP S-malonyltransferase [Candidatus Polarisedimenticolaceae bacterium]